jgi:hypothetical protein
MKERWPQHLAEANLMGTLKVRGAQPIIAAASDLASEEMTVSDTLVRAVATGTHSVPSPFDTTARS